MTGAQRRRPGGGRKAEHTDPAHTFGPWLLEEIRARGMSQAEFSEKVDVKPTTVSRWVNGRKPAGKYLQPIADVLRLDYDFIATKAGYRYPRLGDLRPGTPLGEIVTRVNRVENWTDERLAMVTAMLDVMIEIDEG